MPVEPTAEIPPPPPKKPDAKAQPEGNVKDTIESILVAFILAFVFRAFVVEAFVIPTGSMAPTLLGAHMQYHCADCGYDFTVNFSSGGRGGDMVIPSRAQGTINQPIHCPNCGFAVRETAGPGEDSLTRPPVHYGDRILVLKYRYLLSGPQRWDVIVFKSPDKPPEGVPDYYVTNYIKRLIGKPGESIMILDGDIYVSAAAPPADGAGAITSNPVAFEAFLKTFRIQHKPPHAQNALWRNIYDNDYLPHLAVAERSTWTKRRCSRSPPPSGRWPTSIRRQAGGAASPAAWRRRPCRWGAAR
jgi:signal peptidase I